MRLSTILTLALGVIAPLAEAAALAPPTDATTPLAEAPALAPLADATVEAATNGTMGALARRAGYQNYRYADCQNAGPVRFMDEGICYVVAESTHAIRLNDVPPNCAVYGYASTGCTNPTWFTTRTLGLCTRTWTSNSNRAKSFWLKC